MRKVLFAAVGFGALAATGLAFAHEGGLHDINHFARLDANADGAVTRQEFDAAHDAMFGRLDVDHDGRLTRAEHRAHHRERGDHRGGWGDHHEMRMAAADANNDGDISRDEFLARPLEMFARLDANGDGGISAAERQSARERLAGELDDHGGRAGRPSADSDGDRQISRAEFAAMGNAHFERMDANGDGRITRDEALAARGRRCGE